jgi:hypothetical protein
MGLVLVSGSLFALDLGNGLTLEGEVLGGVRIIGEDGHAMKSEATYDDWEDVPTRFRLTATYKTERFGLAGRYEYRIDAPARDTWAYGWINFLDKMVVLYTGKIDPNHWGTKGDLDANLDGGIIGTKVVVDLKPVIDQPITLGFALPLNNGPGSFTNGFDFDNAFKGYDTKGGIAMGVRYDNPDLATVSLSMRPRYYSGGSAIGGLEMYFGVIVPVKAVGITADITGALVPDGFGSTSGHIEKNAGFQIVPKVIYAQGPINAYLLLNIATARKSAPNADGNKSNLQVRETKKAGDTRVKLELQGQYKVNDMFSPYLRFGVHNLAWFKPGVYFRVGTPINLGASGLTFEIWDELSHVGGSKGDGDAANGEPPYDHRIKNTIQVQLKYKF